jgi:hypothetical protein
MICRFSCKGICGALIDDNDNADIGLGNYQRCSKIITTGKTLPRWGMKWYRGDYQSISAK